MALVSCPECGKSNVSDTAISCPECGFAVKDYFDKIKKEEKRINEKNKISLPKEKIEKIKKLEKEKEEKETKSRLATRIKNSSKQIMGSLLGLFICLPITIICWCFSYHGDLGICIVIFGIATFGSAILLIDGIQEKVSATKDYEIAQKDFEKYRKLQDDKLKASREIGKAYVAQNKIIHPQCPLCGSRNTERISTINRTISVATVGFASSKIGKQYQCKNCKHKW